MPGRREILVAAAAAFVPAPAAMRDAPTMGVTAPSVPASGVPASGIPATGALRFRLVREGSAIGTHTLLFHPTPDGMTITIAVDIVVRFGPLVLYRYRLRGSETWSGGRCVAAASQTDDDGSQDVMRATRDDAGLWVTGTKVPRYLAPQDALVASHWNQAELRGPWINLQNGKLLHPLVAPLGAASVPEANGTLVAARGFAVTGPARMQLWYTPRLVWTGLLFFAKDGSKVRYERMT